jgi:hypothetical protein
MASSRSGYNTCAGPASVEPTDLTEARNDILGCFGRSHCGKKSGKGG